MVLKDAYTITHYNFHNATSIHLTTNMRKNLKIKFSWSMEALLCWWLTMMKNFNTTNVMDYCKQRWSGSFYFLFLYGKWSMRGCNENGVSFSKSSGAYVVSTWYPCSTICCISINTFGCTFKKYIYFTKKPVIYVGCDITLWHHKIWY